MFLWGCFGLPDTLRTAEYGELVPYSDYGNMDGSTSGEKWSKDRSNIIRDVDELLYYIIDGWKRSKE